MTIRTVSVIEDCIEIWRQADRITWDACRLSYLAHDAGYTYQQIGSFVGRDGDTIASHALAWELRLRLEARTDADVMAYLCGKLSVSHFRHVANWERGYLRWMEGATEEEIRASGLGDAKQRETQMYGWLNDCINREDDTVYSSRAFQRELSNHLMRLAGRDEATALFRTLEAFLPRAKEYAVGHIDAMIYSPKQVRELRRLARLAGAGLACIGRIRGGKG